MSFIQNFEANFLWKVKLKILNLGTIVNMFVHPSIQGEISTMGKKKYPDKMACHKLNHLELCPRAYEPRPDKTCLRGF